VHQPICQLPLPPESIITAILRRGEVIIPSGQTVIEPGDELIIVTKQQREAELRELLCAPATT
jgi:Trk K+ transport system NAD-binding subunit